MQLTGTLPGASWADSPAVFLRHLDLSDNHIGGWLFDHFDDLCSCSQKPCLTGDDPAVPAGSVPAEWGYLARLVYLNISTNQLEGPLPPWSFGLPSLVTLDLSFNKISGED